MDSRWRMIERQTKGSSQRPLNYHNWHKTLENTNLDNGEIFGLIICTILTDSGRFQEKGDIQQRTMSQSRRHQWRRGNEKKWNLRLPTNKQLVWLVPTIRLDITTLTIYCRSWPSCCPRSWSSWHREMSCGEIFRRAACKWDDRKQLLSSRDQQLKRTSLVSGSWPDGAHMLALLSHFIFLAYNLKALSLSCEEKSMERAV